MGISTILAKLLLNLLFLQIEQNLKTRRIIKFLFSLLSDLKIQAFDQKFESFKDTAAESSMIVVTKTTFFSVSSFNS